MQDRNLIGQAFVVGFVALVLASAANAQAGKRLSPLGEQIQAAMESEHRTDAERGRDKNRKPVETLEFFQLRPDMKVMELFPGGGWYTKLLAPVLREKGDFAVSLFGGGVVAALKDVEGYESVRLVSEGLDATAIFGQQRVEHRYVLPEFSFAEGSFDLVLTFRNLHNFTPGSRANMHAAVFAATRAGGLYGVVDHTRRHMEPDHDEIWRRMDPVEMIHEIEAAGFEFVDWSDLHHRPDDELRYEVGRASVTGNTDRFTLLFRKPGKR